MKLPIPRPIVKWAGGKRWSVPTIVDAMPRRIGCYYEPFFGGGAVFFELARQGRFDRAFIADSNPEVVETLKVVRGDVESLIEAIKKLRPARITARKYYQIRARQPRSAAARAARFLFLNKCGFNGLYRVNALGTFNVPWGKRLKWDPDVENLRAVSALLREKDVRIVCRDFDESARQVDLFDDLGPGDVGYFDPPYLPETKTSRFAAYTASGFTIHDHLRLGQTFERLAKRGVHVVASNAAVRGAERIYEQIPGTKLYELQCPRAINSKGTARGKVTELLIVNPGFPRGTEQ